MDEKRNLTAIDILSVVGVALDLLNYDLNLKTISNDDIFKELKNQDVNYFEKIISQNNEIITLLKKESNKNG